MRVIPWEVYDNSMISQRIHEIAIGTLLGDAHIARLKHHARMEFTHSGKQKEYIFWKYKALSYLCNKEPREIEIHDERWNATYVQWKFRTRCDPFITHLHSHFYHNRKKIVPKDIHTLLTSPLSLAVWFMDDGGRRNDCYGLFLNTLSFTKAEHELLRKSLRNNFEIDSRLHWIQDGYRIYIPSKSAKRFCEIVDPYILPSMKYKLSYNPVTTSFARLDRARDRHLSKCL